MIPQTFPVTSLNQWHTEIAGELPANIRNDIEVLGYAPTQGLCSLRNMRYRLLWLSD